MSVRRKGAGVLGALLLSGALVACSSGGSGSGGSGGGYKLGFQSPLSGPVGSLGQAYENGFKNAIGWQNSHGGIGGKKISVSYTDDREEGTAAAAAYRQFGQQGVLADFGFEASTETAAVQPLTDSIGVPIVGSTIAPFQKNVFNGGPDLSHEITAEIPLLNSLAQKAGKKAGRVALIYLTTPAGVSAVNFAKKTLAQAGYTVTGSVGIPPDATSFTTQASQVVGWKPDYILSALNAALLEVAQPAIRNSGGTQDIINFWSGASATALAQLHDPHLYVYRVFADPAEDDAATMRAHAKAQNLPDGTSYASGNYYTQGYVMGLVAINVLKACGSSCTASKFSHLLTTSASHVDTPLAGTGSGFSNSNRYFVHGVTYWTWDASTGKPIPVPGLPSAPDYPAAAS